MLYYFLATLYVLSCLLLLLVVLLQQGKGGDMASAFGGGGSQTAFGARAGATVLTRATSVLGVLFMLGAIVLGIIGRQGPGSIMSGVAGPPSGDRAGSAGTRNDPGARGCGANWTGSSRPERRRAAARCGAAGKEVRHILPRESGGTGRRTSLRGWRSQERGGSNPPFRTNNLRVITGLRRRVCCEARCEVSCFHLPPQPLRHSDPTRVPAAQNENRSNE